MSKLRILLSLAVLAAASAAWAEELRTLSGKSVTGTLKKIDGNEIVLDTGSGPVTTPLSQALVLDLRQAVGVPIGTGYFDVRLIDDSVLYAREVNYSGQEVELKLVSGTTLKVPLAYVSAVLKDAQDKNIRKQWEFQMKAKVRGDRIFIFKDNELNAVEGTLGDVDASGKAIEFKREGGGAIKARFDLLQGYAFHRTDVPAETAVCKVIDQDGSTLSAAKLAYDGTTLTATTTFGAKVPLKAEVLAKLDFNLGRLTYLSDLDPARVSDSAFFAGFPSFRKDLNQDGRPIVLQDKAFPKGITLEGGAVVEYNLGGKYKEFKALVGADTRAAEGVLGRTTVTVYCDGEKRLTETVAPADLRPIAVNVKDVGTLRIIVEGPNFTGLSGYATLADARVSQ
jgi:hypothetical protein